MEAFLQIVFVVVGDMFLNTLLAVGEGMYVLLLLSSIDIYFFSFCIFVGGAW